MKYLLLLLLVGCAEQMLPEVTVSKNAYSAFLYTPITEGESDVLPMWKKRLPFPKATDQQWVVKGLTAEKQKTKLWCGAASARILLSAKGKLPEQCQIAGKYHKSDCCKWNGSGACNSEVLVETVLGQYGYSAGVDNTPTFAEIFSLIQKGKAVAIYHYWGESGHSVVAYWAYISGGVKYILTYDPYYGRRVVMDESWSKGNTLFYRLVWVR